MENCQYFNRDVSWLSFNRRVLMEAEDAALPVYERIKFLAIHASNLEEFYKIRVAEHRGVIMRKVHSEEDPAEAQRTLEEIRAEVTRQQQEFFRIFQNDILQALAAKRIVLYMDSEPMPEHRDFLKNYFREEIFPFLQPVMLLKNIRVFIRDNRLYQVACLRKKDTGERFYAITKIPYAKVPRFIELPAIGDTHYYMFVEDVIAANLQEIFDTAASDGYSVEGAYSVKISRDADIYVDDDGGEELVDIIKKKVKKRKIGDLSRFVYDRRMSDECLKFLCKTFQIGEEDMIPDFVHLNMEDLAKLPNPRGQELEAVRRPPMRIPCIDCADWLFPVIRKQDVFFHYPYHAFDYFVRFLTEASVSPNVEEILLTQYRVAQDSEIITSLINAANNGKKVTVFVELKARFDEENNLYTSEMMKRAGINIIYSIPGLKVHAKVALVKARTATRRALRRYAYLSTGNFNEKTAQLYSDMAILTANKTLTAEIDSLFHALETRNKTQTFNHLWVSQFNLVDNLTQKIRRETEFALAGKKSHIILKMNALQDTAMIDELYRASQAGVQIDLIIRGICCLMPEKPFSRNIRIIRIVDKFLEHARVWYFWAGGAEDVYLTSADWMKRNLYRRIETAFPVLDRKIKKKILKILKIQLSDNAKACLLDGNLTNIPLSSSRKDGEMIIRTQEETYGLLLE